MHEKSNVLYSVDLSGLLRWNICTNDPLTWPVIAETEILLVNPLVVIDDKKPTVFTLGNDRHHVLTNRLHFLSSQELAGDNFFCSLAAWLRLLRFTSKQANLPTEVHAVTTSRGGITGEEPRLAPKAATWMMSGQFKLRTAVDTAAIAMAYELKTASTFPLCNELLLDALQACEIGKHREAILFSAISIESLAQYELNKAYEMALLADVPPAHLNIVNVNLAGGQKAKKDPIYSFLTEQENFSRLLHEAPLYILRRSLLCESPDLFAKAKSLYGTRNRLSHGQTVKSSNANLLPVDSHGANSAVQIAVDIFSWFGHPGFLVPDRKLVKIERGSLTSPASSVR